MSKKILLFYLLLTVIPFLIKEGVGEKVPLKFLGGIWGVNQISLRELGCLPIGFIKVGLKGN